MNPPLPVLPEMTLRRRRSSRPRYCRRPGQDQNAIAAVAQRRVPVASVPMKSPSTTLPVVPARSIWTPLSALPEMTSRAAAVVPPTVLPVAPDDLHAVPPLARACVPGDVGADEVARDDVAGGAGVE